jgi:hypothetical protein
VRRGPRAVVVLATVGLALVGAQSARAGSYLGVLQRDVGTTTLHGTRTDLHLYNWLTQDVTNFQAVRVIARNSDGSYLVQSGFYDTQNEGFENCTNTNFILHGFVEWTVNNVDTCFQRSQASLGDHSVKAIRQNSSSSNSKWNTYIDANFQKTSASLFLNSDDVRAGGQSDSNTAASCVLSNYGEGPAWQRTANSDNESQTWSNIDTYDQKIQGGLWSVGNVPGVFAVNNNYAGC